MRRRSPINFSRPVSKCKTRSSEDEDPSGAASDGQRSESGISEMSQSPKDRASRPQPVNILDDEYREDAELAGQPLNPRFVTDKEVEGSGSVTKPSAYEIAKGIADKSSRCTYKQSLAE